MALLQCLTCAGKRIALAVNQALDIESQLDIATAIEPVSCSALVRLELRKLRLPKAQYIG